MERPDGKNWLVFPTFGDLGKKSEAAKTSLFCVIKTLSMFHKGTKRGRGIYYGTCDTALKNGMSIKLQGTVSTIYRLSKIINLYKTVYIEYNLALV